MIHTTPRSHQLPASISWGVHLSPLRAAPSSIELTTATVTGYNETRFEDYCVHNLGNGIIFRFITKIYLVNTKIWKKKNAYVSTHSNIQIIKLCSILDYIPKLRTTWRFYRSSGLKNKNKNGVDLISKSLTLPCKRREKTLHDFLPLKILHYIKHWVCYEIIQKYIPFKSI